MYITGGYEFSWMKLPQKYKDMFKEELYLRNDTTYKLSRGYYDYDQECWSEVIEEMMGELYPALDIQYVREIYLDVCW